jgi:predicted ATP-grasp superfamily ATP-dependent carboligase
MLSVSHVRSPETDAAILIAASSGRALAEAARRAGFRPLAADFFDDLDTRQLCAANRFIEEGLETGFTEANLIPALEALSGASKPCGLVYGAGFEDRPELLEAVARRFTLFGNSPEVVREVKDPERLTGLCAALGIPHPEIKMEWPDDPKNWLVKSIGGAGGSHVAPAGAFQDAGGNIYFQRIAAGTPVSILFLADGTSVQPVGLSRQWAAPAPGQPYRFGGSVRPAGVEAKMEERLQRAAESITAAAGLRGLNSIDFVVEGEDYTLIEINPRPGATLDIFEDHRGGLFRAHIESCCGRLPSHAPTISGAAAAAIAYAPRDIPSMPELDWPDWTADRQKMQSRLQAQEPLCTIKAAGPEPSRALALLEERTAWILGRLEQVQNQMAPMGKETAH